MAILTGCDVVPAAAPAEVISRGKESWAGDWNAVYAIEWSGMPVRGPLVAEMWHAADGRLRIETLESSAVALSSLTLIENEEKSCLYDRRRNRMECGDPARVRIPIASDAVDVWDWLLDGLALESVQDIDADILESGPALRLSCRVNGADRATVWFDRETGLPASFHLHSTVWGEVSVKARSLDAPSDGSSALFEFESLPGMDEAASD